jgi:hypothetical protein
MTMSDEDNDAENEAPEQVMLNVPRHALPASCAQAFELFQPDFEQALGEQPRHLDRQLDGIEAAFLPDYDGIKPTSWLRIVGIAALFCFFVLLAVGILNLVVLLSLPQSWIMPVSLVLYALGGLVGVGLTIWSVGGEVRDNRRKREQGPEALGLYLLADALVQRTGGGCSYFPRASLLSVYKEQIRAGGNSAPLGRGVGFSYGLRYRDIDGREQKKGLFVLDSSPSSDTRQLVRLRRWFDETG